METIIMKYRKKNKKLSIEQNQVKICILENTVILINVIINIIDMIHKKI
jgi:hypothetical protein